MTSAIDDAYNNYFGTETKKEENTNSTGTVVITNDDMSKINLTETDVNSDTDENSRTTADSNINDIDQLGDLIRIMLNAAWGKDWGQLSPELIKGENSEDTPLPQITFDINSREVAENTPVKPKLTDTIIELVNGEKTGDVFNVYRQWFDCIVEFNFWGSNTLEARKIMNNFENLIGAYSGYLKRQGVSELFFLKEISPKLSVKYVEGIPMRSLMYYVRLERVQTIRTSILKKIDSEVNVFAQTNRPTTEQLNSSDNIFKNNNITYEFENS